MKDQQQQEAEQQQEAGEGEEVVSSLTAGRKSRHRMGLSTIIIE
jgi:hypothetical protein